jgi:hypothetical protein
MAKPDAKNDSCIGNGCALPRYALGNRAITNLNRRAIDGG